MTIKAVLFDIDGTLMTGMDSFPGAGSTLEYLREKNIPFRFISNGTRRSRRNVFEKLLRIGVDISPDLIFTPASAAIEYLISRGIESCYLIGTDDLASDFSKAGIRLQTHSSVVVVGDAGDKLGYHALNCAFRVLMNDGELFALEMDRFWMDTDGLSLGAGPFVTALQFASGREALLLGKPSPMFFQSAISTMQARPDETIMVGDDILTDIGGAQKAGMKGILVRTGKYRREIEESSPVTPDRVIDSVQDLPQILESL